MKAAIIEDEKMHRDLLSSYIEAYSFFKFRGYLSWNKSS